jgi:hypothetical protein
VLPMRIGAADQAGAVNVDAADMIECSIDHPTLHLLVLGSVDVPPTGTRSSLCLAEYYVYRAAAVMASRVRIAKSRSMCANAFGSLANPRNRSSTFALCRCGGLGSGSVCANKGAELMDDARELTDSAQCGSGCGMKCRLRCSQHRCSRLLEFPNTNPSVYASENLISLLAQTFTSTPPRARHASRSPSNACTAAAAPQPAPTLHTTAAPPTRDAPCSTDQATPPKQPPCPCGTHGSCN